MSDERRFPLDCGPEVTVQACYYDRTYSGLIEGVPSQEFNDRIVAGALRLADTLWPGSKIHLIPPAITMMVRGLRLDWARKRAKRVMGSEARAIVIRRVFRGSEAEPAGLYVDLAGKST